jgi:divalent metal cation (Fe/Co/Zn/Cd) transporter
MLLNLLLVVAIIIAIAGTYIPWSKVQGLSAFYRKTVCAVYILSWLVLVGFGIAGVDYFYSMKEALR